MSKTTADSVSFADLGLDDRLLAALETAGFDSPTPIQAAAIPVFLSGRDVIGRARTGSGKTAAFMLPILQRLAEKPGGPGALILAPTREIANQIARATEPFARAIGEQIATVYGGVPHRPQEQAIRRSSIVVGTPGRLLDLLNRGSLKLGATETVVLDEADEMLRMGFLEDVETLLDATSDERQLALFSATMPKDIRRIAKERQKDPETVQVEEGELTVHHITQGWMRVPRRHRVDAMIRLLQTTPEGATLIFARTRADCAEYADALVQRGVSADAMHGDLNQNARERLVRRMRSGILDVIVATDIAARGLDIDHISTVVNLELPRDKESYVHRIGRTGRAGRVGVAVTFVGPRQIRHIKELAKALKVPIEKMEVPSDSEIQAKMREQLLARLVENRKAAQESGTAAWVASVLETDDWTPTDLAIAALEQLSNTSGGSAAGKDEQPPAWSVGKSTDRPERGQRDRGMRPDNHDETNAVEIFFPIGREQGVRPGDLVGAIANESGIPGNRIGRIHIHHDKSFVGMAKADAEQFLANNQTLEIRGNSVSVSKSFGRPPNSDRKPHGKRPGGSFKKGPPKNHGPRRDNRGPGGPQKKAGRPFKGKSFKKRGDR